MIHNRRFCVAAAAALVAAFTAASAGAEDTVAAQALFDQAKKAMAAHQYEEACPKLEESYRLDPGLGTLLNLGDCYEHQGRLATAWGKFTELEARARAAGQESRSRIGKQRAAALAPKLSNLVVNVTAPDTAGLEVRRDGVAIGRAEWGTPIPADAGEHTIEATAPDHESWSAKVTVPPDAKTAAVAVPMLEALPADAAQTMPVATVQPTGPAHPATLPATPPESKSHGLGGQRAWALVAGGLGLVGVGVGTYFGLASMSKHDDATKVCPTSTCTGPNAHNGSQLWSDAVKDGNVATIAFIVGGVGLATGVTLWLTAPASRDARSVGLVVGPGHLALRGDW
jgi:hypothetical protein